MGGLDNELPKKSKVELKKEQYKETLSAFPSFDVNIDLPKKSIVDDPFLYKPFIQNNNQDQFQEIQKEPKTFINNNETNKVLRQLSEIQKEIFLILEFGI